MHATPLKKPCTPLAKTMHAPWQKPHMPPGATTHATHPPSNHVRPPCGQTDTCKNITFANFFCGRKKLYCETKLHMRTYHHQLPDHYCIDYLLAKMHKFTKPENRIYSESFCGRGWHGCVDNISHSVSGVATVALSKLNDDNNVSHKCADNLKKNRLNVR